MRTQILSVRIAKVVALAAALVLTTSVPQAKAATTGGVPIFAGWTAYGSSVTCTDHAPRTFSSKQSATFLQSWLADSIYKKLPVQTPPTRLPVCTLIMQYAVNGTRQPALHISYATDGHSAWLSSDKQKWVVAPQSQRVINSFDGRGIYEPVVSSSTVPSSSVPISTVPVRSTAQPDASKDSSAVPIVATVVGAALVALIALVILRRRRR